MEQNNPESESSKDNGFLTGLVVGVVLGGVSNFFLRTEKGKKLKKKLFKEGKNLWEELEDLFNEGKKELLEAPKKDGNSLKEKVAKKVIRVKKFFVKNGKVLKR